MRLRRLITIITSISVEGNQYQQNAYDRVVKMLENRFSVDDNVTIGSIRDMPFTNHMRDKLCDILRNPPEVPPKYRLLSKLLDVHGLSREKAISLIEDGVRSMGDLKKREWSISSATRTYVQYMPNRKIPRATVQYIHDSLPAYMTIVGSYRRKKEYSRDIDVLITDDHADNVVGDVSRIFEFHVLSRGRHKISAIIKGPTGYVKIDVFVTKKEAYVPMLLYLTGSKQFNIKMRNIAKRQGMTLNQYGLFSNGKQLRLSTEQDYFDALGMSYMDPEHR